MTQQVRKAYKRHRKWAWIGAVAVLATAALAVSLPALAGPAGEIPPATTLQGITPTLVDVGGSNFNCATNAHAPAGTRQFQISKPTPGAYTDPATGVTFTIDDPTGSQDPKAFFSFSTGGAAAVLHVGVNGGTNTAWYDYENGGPNEPYVSGVSEDTDLHSTLASKKDGFYVASITTFCYVPVTVTPSCTSPFSGIAFGGNVAYTAQLQEPADGRGCKPDAVVMYTATTSNGIVAALHETPGASGTPYWVIERIRWTKPGSNVQNAVFIKYDDIGPVYGDVLRDALMCNSDLRTGEFTVSVSGSPSNAATMMPAGHTTCVIQSTDLTGGKYEAFLLSSVDGYRFTG